MKIILLFFITLAVLFPSTHVLAKQKETPVCERHHQRMLTDRVPILYGLPSREEMERRDYEEKNFPNANTEAFGGCVVEHKKKVKVFYCSECRREQEVWRENLKRKKE